MNQNEKSFSLIQTPANQKTIALLYSKGLINQQSYDLALALFYPQRWGYWIANSLLILGVAFLLIGIVFFFAFNWQKMSTFYKFSIIEVALVCSLIGAWAYSTHRLFNTLFLMTSCVLVGVFWAVFGQIYQTGADTYQFFTLWTILITPWVIIGRSPSLWALWIILLNTSIILYWRQSIEGNVRTDDLIFSLLLIVNTALLFSIEHITKNSLTWVNGRWLRIILVIVLLLTAAVPINNFIMLITVHHSIFAIFNLAMLIAGIIGIALHCGLIWFYTFKSPDIWVLALTGLSASLLILTLSFDILKKIGLENTILYLIMCVLTLSMFTATAFLLKKINARFIVKS